MNSLNLKEKAIKLVNDLPEDATWDDLMYKIYVQQAIEAGIKDSDAGKTMSVRDVRAKFGLPK